MFSFPSKIAWWLTEAVERFRLQSAGHRGQLYRALEDKAYKEISWEGGGGALGAFVDARKS